MLPESASVQVAEQINRLPRETLKYVVAADDMVTQPVMFLTRSYTEKQQQETNINYVLSDSCCQVAMSQPQSKVFCLAAGTRPIISDNQRSTPLFHS